MIKFKWEKLGLIAKDVPQKEWSKAYLQFPTAIKIDGRTRIFFTTRPEPEPDGKNVTYIRSLDIKDLENRKIIEFSENPIIALGNVGEFDEFGTMPGDIVEHNSKLYMYYTGWGRLQSVPYNFSIGLAISEDRGLTFKKFSNGPILSISTSNPFTVGSGAVIKRNNIIHLYYIAGLEWLKINHRLEHTYTIKHAVSEDGINWNLLPEVAIERKNRFEALAAPSIIEIDSVFHMWFSYRGSYDFRNGVDSYKIGYAYSFDLYNWHRADELAGIDISQEGWDSKMICYPYIVKEKGNIYMLYNGNYFGKESLGIAKLMI